MVWARSSASSRLQEEAAKLEAERSVRIGEAGGASPPESIFVNRARPQGLAVDTDVLATAENKSIFPYFVCAGLSQASWKMDDLGIRRFQAEVHFSFAKNFACRERQSVREQAHGRFVDHDIAKFWQTNRMSGLAPIHRYGSACAIILYRQGPGRCHRPSLPSARRSRAVCISPRRPCAGRRARLGRARPSSGSSARPGRSHARGRT